MADVPPPPGSTGSAERRASWLLGAGAALGLVLAAVGLLTGRGGADALPRDAIAAVNGKVLRVEEYERAVEALASDRRNPVGEKEKRHVLDRLLDEELLVQRGLELGLARHDRRIRGDIVSAVIQDVVQQTETTEPSEAEIKAFYDQNREYFARTGRLFVQQVWVHGRPQRDEEEARARAQQAAERLRAGEPFATVNEQLGDPQVAPAPSGYLPATKLREYLGPTATQAALALEPGQVSDPVRSTSGYHVLQLVGLEKGSVPPLAQIEDQVRAELVRRSGDRALRRYLEQLRKRADVRVARTLP